MVVRVAAAVSDASDNGEGADDFMFEISKDEYLDLLFDDLELPNMEKNQIAKLVETKSVRAGYTSNGVPTNINIVRSLQNSLARRVVLQSGKKRLLAELEAQLVALGNDETNASERLLLEKEIAELKRRIDAVPLSTPLICGSTTLSNARFLPVRPSCFV